MGEYGIASTRYVGPDDGEIRTGAPEYPGGRIYPVDPAAHAKLRAFWQEQRHKCAKRPTKAENNSARDLARALQKRRKTGGKEPMKRKSLEPWEEEQLAALIEANSSDKVLEEWRQATQVNGNTMKRLVRETRAKRNGLPPKSAAETEIAAEPPPVIATIAVEPAAVIAPIPAVPTPAEEIEPAAVATIAAEPPAVIVPIQTVPTPPQSLEPVISWLSNLRAMRDELAAHGVIVEGSLRIRIDL